MPAKQVDISTFEPRQLQAVQESLESEINNLANSSMALQKAAGEYGNSGRALEHLAEQKEGQPMLLPITSAVYVSGNLMSNDKILLDIGTGYFAERSPADGVDYCRRKVSMLRENLDKIGQAIKEKQHQLTIVGQTLQAKTQAAQQQQQ